MTKHELNTKYFEWMYQLVCNVQESEPSYRRLLAHLHSVDFNYTIQMDGNRAEDGIDLRYRFGREKHIEDTMIASYLDDRPCSVLEMMVALSLRCEESIMEDPDVGNRPDRWFQSMLRSMYLDMMTDEEYVEEFVDDAIDGLIDREYYPDGRGGLFTIPDCPYDLRDVEIWYQAMWYLNEKVRG